MKYQESNELDPLTNEHTTNNSQNSIYHYISSPNFRHFPFQNKIINFQPIVKQINEYSGNI